MSNNDDLLVKNPLIRVTLIAIGWLSIVLGVIGIFLPLLPTTPFLLLAAACFARSSNRFHTWLLSHPYLGDYIKLYLDGKGIPLRAKVYILVAMWITIATSFYFVAVLAARIILPIVAICVTFYICRLPTLKVAEPCSTK